MVGDGQGAGQGIVFAAPQELDGLSRRLVAAAESLAGVAGGPEGRSAGAGGRARGRFVVRRVG
jgi:PPE-repeat protein